MRGVILAGGRARRLRPLSLERNKHLLLVHDAPLICYPLRTLAHAGVRDIAIVTNADHAGDFSAALGAGSRFGCRLTYLCQDDRPGTGAALLAAGNFAGREPFAVMLGDNIFTEAIRPELLRPRAGEAPGAAKVFVREVHDPGRYGVAIFDRRRIVDIIEKPAAPAGNCAVTGLWRLPPDVFDRASRLQLSARGEYEMTDVLAEYARERLLAHAFVMSRWMDVGTFESLADARAFFSIKEAARAYLESPAFRPVASRPPRVTDRWS